MGKPNLKYIISNGCAIFVAIGVVGTVLSDQDLVGKDNRFIKWAIALSGIGNGIALALTGSKPTAPWQADDTSNGGGNDSAQP